MKILLAPYGTRGDVQPLIALGLALKNRGHEVDIAAPDNFKSWVESLGLPFHSAGVDIEQAILHLGDDAQKLTGQFRHMIGKMIPAQFDHLPNICPDADIIIGAGIQLAGPSVAESRGARYLTAVYCPVALPSSDYPFLAIPWQGLPRFVNRLSWWAGQRMGDLLLRKPVNRGREKLGLAPVSNMMRYLISSGPVILAADPVLAPVPPDVIGDVLKTGAWVFEESGALADDLEEFLSDGDPAVYVGFGSMVSDDPDRVTRIVIEAAQMASCRLVLGSGWSGLGIKASNLPRWSKVVASTPHHLLFARVAAVAHHGGAGTTTTAARAGAPQIIVPHLLDQFYWGHRVHALGLGPRPLAFRRLSAPRLAARLKAAINDCAFRNRAKSAGDEIRNRNGIDAGVRIIEQQSNARR